MGRESVELVMTFEERFGVTITESEAATCATPKGVIELIFGKLRASDQQVCVSQRAFHLLRRGLTQTLGVPRRSVRLGDDMRRFAAGESERQVWGDLRNVVQARSWPVLARPRWVVHGGWVLSAGVFVAAVAVWPWGVAACAALLLALAVAVSTRPLRSRIPARYSRLRELVPFAVTSEAIAWTRDQVASLVKKVATERLALQEGQYGEDAHFVKDLGMDR